MCRAAQRRELLLQLLHFLSRRIEERALRQRFAQLSELFFAVARELRIGLGLDRLSAGDGRCVCSGDGHGVTPVQLSWFHAALSSWRGTSFPTVAGPLKRIRRSE